MTTHDEAQALLHTLIGKNGAGRELLRESMSSTLLVRLSEYCRRNTPISVAVAGACAPRGATHAPTRALGELFGPIRVNPNSRHRTELTIKSFVHGMPGQFPASHQTAISINGSDEEIEGFVRILIDRSRAHREVHHARVAGCRRFDLVIGERGVGKTFFQNYLLSRFSRRFDKERVLYIRVNLLRDFVVEGDRLKIDHWVKSQIAKVVCRYYDPHSHADGHQDKAADLKLDFNQLVLDKIAQDESIVDKEAVRKSLRNMIQNFRLSQSMSEADIDSSTVDPVVANTIFQAVVDTLKMSVVVVFDGLDLLGYTDLSKARYDAILKALRVYLTSDAAPHRYHLIFLRPETLHDFQDNIGLRQQLNPLLDGNPHGERHFGLRPIDTAKMWRQRLRALSDESIIKHYDIDLDLLRDFNEFLLEPRSDPLGGEGVSSYAQAIVTMAGNNSRFCVQLIMLAYHSFLLTRIAPPEELIKSYQLTEMMMLAGQDYPPSAYRYWYDEAGRFHCSSALRLYEADYLPSIFRAPILEEMRACDLYANGGIRQVLLPLRIMQLIAARSRQRTGTSRAYVSAMAIRDFAKQIFGYTDLEIQRTIEELCEEELVSPNRRVDIRLPSPANQFLFLAPKGVLILDALLHDPTYLGLACYNLPVPQSMVENKGARRYFRGATPGPNAAWIVSKIWNSYSLFQIVKSASAIQSQDIDHRRPQMDPSTQQFLARATAEVTPGHGGLFNFVQKIEDRLLELTVKILRSVPPGTDLHRELWTALGDLNESVTE